jgi:hypothetical protein
VWYLEYGGGAVVGMGLGLGYGGVCVVYVCVWRCVCIGTLSMEVGMGEGVWCGTLSMEVVCVWCVYGGGAVVGMGLGLGYGGVWCVCGVCMGWVYVCV